VRNSERKEITLLLAALHDQAEQRGPAVDRLFEAAYTELRLLAGAAMRRERAGHTMQPSELVNEAYLRLVDVAQTRWESRAHFFGVAARAMRQILVEHARRRAAAKRGGGWHKVTLDDCVGAGGGSVLDLLALDDALVRLRIVDARMERVVELRVFGGLEVREIAHVLGVSDRTVNNDWRVAKLWLTHELSKHDLGHREP